MSLLTLEGLVDEAFTRRFWLKVDRNGECWTWTAYRQRGGYGQFTVRKGLFAGAHRVSYLLANGGALTRQDFICHRCDNPPCVRPDHLFVGTGRDNTLDSIAKGRATRARGERTASARLTERDVLEIRTMSYRYGLWTELSRQYGVTAHTIAEVWHGRIWRHVALRRVA